jgi:hypothetical protein
MDSHYVRNNSLDNENTGYSPQSLALDRAGVERFIVVGGKFHPPETTW